jgi:DNA-binding response OmpR family regulator
MAFPEQNRDDTTFGPRPWIGLVATGEARPASTARPLVALLGDAWLYSAWSRSLRRADTDVVLWELQVADPARSVLTRVDCDLIVVDGVSERALQASLDALEKRAPLALIANEVTHGWGALLERGVLLLPPPVDEPARDLLARHLAKFAGEAKRRRDGLQRTRIDIHPGVTFDLTERCVIVAGKRKDIAPGEAAILRFLLMNDGRWSPTLTICRMVFSRSDPAASKLVWKYLSRLRQKLVPHQDFIEVSRSRGYRVSARSAVHESLSVFDPSLASP